MATLQSIILTILITLLSSILGISSERDKAFLHSQFEQLFVEESQEILAKTTVIRIIDGDTIVIRENGVEQKVRLIGIDTPETVDPRKEVECFGKEASLKAESLLLGESVRLEADFSQGDKDKYGRLLRYVFLTDGTHANLVLIQEGFAHEYTYDLPYKYQELFKEAEQNARSLKKGLWGDICNFSENT